MEKKNPLFHTIVFALVLVGVLFLAAYFLPWQRVNWGKLSFLPASTVTVTGQAKKEESSQIARFTAGVTVNNDNKEEAISEVNEKVGEIIQAVKDFGISEEDIQTQNVSISKREDTFVIREEIGEWRASNSIEIVLRDVDKASDLADLLMSSGATNVSGPRFSLDDTQAAEVSLLEQAIDNAREKAESIAQSSDRILGKIISVSEGASQPIRTFGTLELAPGGAPIEPGTETVAKTVTVVFELE